MSRGHRLKIFYEGAGEREDRDLEDYTKLLRSEGMPFDKERSSGYGCLEAKDFQDVLLGEPNRITKKVPMVQISDLILYPMAKGGYDPNYAPYKKLIDAKILIDCQVPEREVQNLGIKYSCFDHKK